MVARNAWASNSRLFLGDGGGRVEFRVRCDFCSIGAGTAIFVEPLDSQGEALAHRNISDVVTFSLETQPWMKPPSELSATLTLGLFQACP